MEDWLKKWYSDQFNKIDLSPSSEVWDNISVSMEEWPKHWYKSNTNQLKTEPRPSTWESIHSQLADINYPAKNARPAYALIAIAIFILSLIPISLSDGYISLTGEREYFSDNYQIDNAQKSSDESSLENTDDNYSDKSTSSKTSVNYPDIAINKKPEEIVSYIDRNNNNLNEKLDDNKSINVIPSEELISSHNPLPIIKNETPNKLIDKESDDINNGFDILSLSQVMISYPKINLREDLVFQPKDDFNPNYSIGLHFVPQFSSLLNPLRTKVRANQNAEMLNPISIGLDLSFEKYINSKNSLRVNVRGNNIKSLQFKEQNTLKEMTMNYASLELAYSRRWRLGNSDKLLLKTYAGIFTGYAVSKGVNYNGDRIAYIEDGLKNMDFGNSIGLVLSKKLSDKMRLEIGANSQFGVMSIFKGTDLLPSKYFRTSTVSYGLSFGLIREF